MNLLFSLIINLIHDSSALVIKEYSSLEPIVYCVLIVKKELDKRGMNSKENTSKNQVIKI